MDRSRRVALISLAASAASAAFAILWLSGCATEPYFAPDNAEPATAKMTAQPVPQPPGRRISNLLDFESGTDLTFVATDPPEAAMIDTAIARSGSHCLVLAGGATSLSIK